MNNPASQFAAHGVSKALGDGATRTVAVAGATLEIHPGELLFLMGPSGSGKTTLLSMLGGILRPDSGEVVIAGVSTSALSQAELAKLRRRHVGYVFQAYNLFPGLTASKNVLLGLAVRGAPVAQSRQAAELALATVGLDHKLGHRAAHLSGGEQQRVAIARAIAGNTTVLLADEPTAALDSQKGREIMTLLKRLAREGNRAVLVVTHDTRLLSFADRVALMADGRIVGDDREGSTDTDRIREVGHAS